MQQQGCNLVSGVSGPHYVITLAKCAPPRSALLAGIEKGGTGKIDIFQLEREMGCK